MKTLLPTYEKIKSLLAENKAVFIQAGKNKVKIQNCFKDKKGTFVISSVGEHRIDLFSELYVE